MDYCVRLPGLWLYHVPPYLHFLGSLYREKWTLSL
jgi:hypothetical protein